VVLPDSHEIPRAPCYLGNTHARTTHFVYGTVTLYGHPFNDVRLHAVFLTHPTLDSAPKTAPTTPDMQRLSAITHARFSLIRFRSPLLTESLLFSLPDGTEMFHFPPFPLHTLYIQVRVTRNDSSRVTPFGNPRITARLPAPRGLSQAPTSFIGS
jgi:hypothetical protein